MGSFEKSKTNSLQIVWNCHQFLKLYHRNVSVSHRSINHGITYDYVGENMWAVGPPFTFCRSPGLWDAMFKCKELSKYDTLTTRTRVKILSFLCGF